MPIPSRARLAIALFAVASFALERPVPLSGAERSFPVRDFGALPDGKTESGAAIRAAIQAAGAAGPGAEVTLEAGVYRVRPEEPRGSCFPIRAISGLTVRGAPERKTAILVADPASSAFTLFGCRGIAIRDLVVDYDPLPFTQGTVKAVDETQGHFDLECEPGFPTPDAENFLRAVEPYGKWGMILDRATRRIRAETPDHFMTPRWEHRGDRVWRFFTAEEHYRRNLRHMRPGDAYVHLARGHGSAFLVQACENARLEDITVFASPGLAVGLVGNRGSLVVEALEVGFAPGTPRLLSTNADGVHCQQNRVGPIVENCRFEGMADDAVNIYAPPNVLRELRSPTEWLVSAGTLILPGDRLQVLDPRTGRIRGEVKVVRVTPESGGVLLALETPFAGAVAGEDHRAGDTLYDLDACGAGFRIRGNRMKGNRRYGCLLRAGGGLVEDNIFEDTTGAGIVLTNEPDWPEGPVPWGITIRRNRFLRGGTCLGYADSPQGAALSVRSVKLGGALADGEGIRDIRIEDNEFIDRAGASIYIGGADTVTLLRNRISGAAEAGLRRRGGAIVLERSRRIAIEDTAVSDPRSGVTSAVEILASVEAGGEGVVVRELRADLAPGAKPIDDRREVSGTK